VPNLEVLVVETVLVAAPATSAIATEVERALMATTAPARGTNRAFLEASLALFAYFVTFMSLSHSPWPGTGG
jgi:hypothetical protein